MVMLILSPMFFMNSVTPADSLSLQQLIVKAQKLHRLEDPGSILCLLTKNRLVKKLYFNDTYEYIWHLKFEKDWREEKAKVVAAAGGIELIQFLAALVTYFAPGRFE